jgi:hypothetical protein
MVAVRGIPKLHCPVTATRFDAGSIAVRTAAACPHGRQSPRIAHLTREGQTLPRPTLTGIEARLTLGGPAGSMVRRGAGSGPSVQAAGTRAVGAAFS